MAFGQPGVRTTAENVQIDCVVPELLTCHYSDWCPTLGTCRQKLPAAGRWRCPVCRQPQHRTLLAETRRLRRPFGRETWKFLLEIPVKIGCILFTLKKKKKKKLPFVFSCRFGQSQVSLYPSKNIPRTFLSSTKARVD